MAEDDGAAPISFEGDDEDYEGGEDGIDFRFVELDEDGIAKNLAEPASPAARPMDRARLEGVLQDLIAARQLLDSALREG